MNIKQNFFVIAFVLFASFAFAQRKADMLKSEKPNILFIAIDDMNDWTGFLGGHPDAITPNLDKLAKKGISFTNAHCPAPACSPSRNALLYGIEPFNSGSYPFYELGIHDELADKYISLPHFLKESGYSTYGAGKIHHGSFNDEREWTEYFKSKPIKKQFKEGLGYHHGKGGKMSFRATLNPDDEHIDHQVASYGIDILKEKHQKPFFLAVGIVKPHLPFDAPVRFFDALPDEVDSPEILKNDLDDIPKVGREMKKSGSLYDRENKWNEVRRAYLACISWADYNIGRVLDELEKSPYADNTIIVLWSDHGYHLGEKMSFKKFTLWEEATRVPFIIYDPRTKMKNKQDCSQPVSLIDIYKTLGELVDLKIPEYVNGTSLVPLLREPEKHTGEPAITTWGRGNYAVRSNNWRYIRYFDGSEELYSHENDKNEWYNLANKPEYDKRKAKLAKYLPKHEAPIIKKDIVPWSVEGFERKKYRPNAGEEK